MKNLSGLDSSAKRPPLKDRSSGIKLLMVSAVAAVVFTGAGGLLMYSNTQHLIETRKWLEHSHKILTNLQVESQRLDRVGYGMELYKASGDPRALRSAMSAAAALQTGAISLEALVKDNASQARHVQDLQANAQELMADVDGAATKKTTADHEIQESRSTISLLQNEERGLLGMRSDDSETSGVRSLVAGAGYLGFSMLVVIGLFGFLLRDAFRRRLFQQDLSVANGHLGATIEELERRGAEARMLKDARDELQLCMSSEEAQACTARHLEELVPGSCGAILIVNNSRNMLAATASWNDPPLADGFELGACCGLRAGRARWRKEGQSELNCTHFTGTPPQNYLCVPLAAHGETLGFAFLGFPTEEICALASRRIKLVSEMVELASMAIAGLNLRMKLESQSIRDGLTSLFNRHFMEIALERELHRAHRRGASLAVLMVDVDHFKMFNDTYGHEAGDEILRRVAGCFSQSVRSEDIVCRYGGEEFVILLPEISEDMAVERAELIRRNVSALQTSFRGSTLRQITISIGVATYPEPAKNAADLLRMADFALYEAKNSGRNQVSVAGEMVGMGMKAAAVGEAGLA